ncbi:hypothetical protein CONCODRAFT_80115 [Conidiobolus coronatus NRRL 28638]|uniref:Uncharacterized protein n=1 Tax=Conidiobolus coronatus (strain ATCC 28846 / CBS 209.66 / NRRL 28638) TaxID=796925 RepID=A0A137NXV7_CONC2|nr:hypothetical protein CONCODRAFT_80115 [Conidiobolus coronatus NRRL 28638]|eukprot:KXN67501.1 hypothetical protein CONCODRAFT_80115 [Conidiobolus coronatus NRRL 28638]
MSNTIADNYRYLIGKTLIDLGKEAQINKTNKHVLESELPKPRRVIKPGQLYSADYNENRLHITINDKNMITLVKNC